MDRWLFIHVMKTAGTSFRAMLEDELGERIYPTRKELKQLPNGWYPDAPELLARIADGRIDLAEREVLCGHYPAALAGHLPGRWRTVIFLRDPIARTLSMISHRTDHQKGIFGFRLGPRKGVSDWLANEEFVANQILNYQTKVLASDGLFRVNRPLPIDEAAFQRARERLMSLDVVGLTEEMEPSVRLFERLSGRSLGKRIPFRNKSRNTYDATPEEVEKIRALVSYDLKLYELAREKLHSEMSVPA